ncbi:MAG: O-antigen ligase family protein [Lachnospiraceae bacterium]|nr:O-antigen ligase family protein [Lachnospiraceae bacterium]
MELRINITKLTHIILFGALFLLYSCGFSFLQSYQLQALMIATAVLIFMFFSCKEMTIKKKQVLLLIFALYVVMGMFVWGVEKERISLIIYITALLIGVLYVLNNVQVSKTEAFFKVIQYVAIFEAVTIFLSVAIPGLMPQKLGFLYRPLVIDTMNKELGRGIYSGFIGEKAAAAYLLNLGLAYTLSRVNIGRKLDKRNLLITAALFIAILFTGKRVLLLTAALMFLASLLAGQPIKKKIKAVAIILLGVIGLIVFVKFVPAANITFERFMMTDSYETMNGREDMWASAIEIFHNNPILGCGYGSYQKISGSLYNGHNSYLQLLAEIGIVGCAMLAIISIGAIIRAMINLHSKKSAENYLALNLLIITFLYAYTGNVFHTPTQLITFFMAISIIYSYKKSLD